MVSKLTYLEVWMNYKITKIGLLNFWYFDCEEFNFSDGKLLLRGGNGSGKSVTMQSFIPLILDGNKTPSRLDPFGSKEKRIEDYVLGPSDSIQKDDAISYLYMETFNKEMDKYITIGIGLRSKKGRGTDFFGFALKDGKRIGKDFLLYKDYGQKILLTKNELRSRLGSENEFVETAKEYKKMVNNLLFKFPDLDSYDEFINVLLQLRSSKLSKDYTPVKLMNILSGVLQPLLEDDLRPISEAIEDTNKTKEKIETLTRQTKALNNFLKTYQNYNEILLYNKALNFSEEEKNKKKCESKIKSLKQELEENQKRFEEIKINIRNLDTEFNQNKARLDTIDDKDLKKHTIELEILTKDIKDLNEQISLIKQRLEKIFDKERKTKKLSKELDDKIYLKEKEVRSLCEDIILVSEDIYLNDIKIALNKFLKDNEINFEYLEERINKYKNKVNQIKLKLDEKEAIEGNLNLKLEEHLNLKKNYEKIEDEMKKCEKVLNEEADKFKDQLNSIIKDNKFVKIDEDTRQKIFTYINNYNYDNYVLAKELYRQIGTYEQIKAYEDRNNLNTKLKIERDLLDELNKELVELKNNKEIEYENENSDETIIKLEEKNIPYIPLYKAIEFTESISENVKNKIEEILISMNILNAFIIKEENFKDIKDVKGVFLRHSTFKKNNLLKYFKVVDNEKISTTEVTNILKCISVDINDTNYVDYNKYKLDFIVGQAGDNYKSKYIGILKRIEERTKQIKLKEEEIKNKESIIINYQNLLNSISNRIDIIKEEINFFPSNQKLERTNNEISKLDTSLNIISQSDQELTDVITKMNKELELKIRDINNLKENMQIPLTLAHYNQTLNLIDSIIKNIYELKNINNSLEVLKISKISCENSLSDIKIDIEYKNEELFEKNSSLDQMQAKKQAILDILDNPDYKNIIDEVKKLTERQSQIPNLKSSLSKEEGKLEIGINTLINDIKEAELKLEKYLLKLALKQDILTKEYNLNYVYQDNNIDVDKILIDLNSRKNSDQMRALTNYLSAFNEYRTELLEYRINTKEIFNNEKVYANYLQEGMDKDEIDTILKSAIRQDLTAVYQGKVINIFELNSCLEGAILESQSYISTQERHLFEDILLKTVGNKIRDRIDSSKKWVAKMNDIMKNTQMDSNLSFQLEWKNKQAFTEDELDTKELVRLFQIDPGMIKPSDSEKLITHFRSKIKKELEYSDSYDSYTNIISRVLDYRNWFEFKLYYKRKSGEKKELTNKVFFIFSGGERAKSMYVPLFAAVYAKLLSAKENSLRIIALDEAFAGVDNDNIREMFNILTKLNLDYILTSQALWGDYDTIKDLSICELIKDEQAKAVGVRRYHWNGQVKEFLENIEE